MSRLIRWHERTVSRYQHVSWAGIVAACGRFSPLEERSVRWDQPMTRELLAERVRSISYIATLPCTHRESLAAEVVELVRHRTEPVTLPYTCLFQWDHPASRATRRGSRGFGTYIARARRRGGRLRPRPCPP